MSPISQLRRRLRLQTPAVAKVVSQKRLLEHMDAELVEVLDAIGTLDEVINKTVAIIEAKVDGNDAVLPVADWIDKIIEVTLM